MSKQTDRYEQIGVAMTCRGYAEYERMFDLDDTLLRLGTVLDVAAGASSFAAEARSKGLTVMSADPRYRHSADQLEAEGLAEIASSSEKLGRLADRFDWSYYGDLERHRAGRLESLRLFVQDYAEPDRRERYRAEQLPHFSFADDTFSLVLCSHFLFLYREQFDDDFHRGALAELLRVCRPGGEVRIYPLLGLDWKPYPRFDDLIAYLESLGAECRLRQSELPFIPGSTQMLCILK